MEWNWGYRLISFPDPKHTHCVFVMRNNWPSISEPHALNHAHVRAPHFRAQAVSIIIGDSVT